MRNGRSRHLGRSLVVICRLLGASTMWLAAAPAIADDSGPHLLVVTKPPAENSAQPVTKVGVTRRDLAALTEILPELEVAAPVRAARRKARRGDQIADAQVLGVTAPYFQLHPLTVRAGRLLDGPDHRRSRSAAVIDKRVAAQLFAADADPIGRRIGVGRNYFTVVGVVESPPRGSQADKAARTIFIPLTTMQSRFGDLEIQRTGGAFVARRYELSRIEIRLRDAGQRDRTARLVRQILDRLHDDETYLLELRHPQNRR